MATLTHNSTSQRTGFRAKLSHLVGQLGRIGKALLFPIATLPIAAILLRIGAQIPDGTSWSHFVHSVLVTGGSVIFDNLPIVFAIGVAFGLARDNRGEAALAGFIGMTLLMLLMKSGGADLPKQIYAHSSVDFHNIFGDKYDAVLSGNVLNGIIAGGLIAFIYNKFNGTELPTVLGFFSGRRLIPVLSILGVLVFGIVYAVVFPWVGWVIFKFSTALSDATGNKYGNAGIMLAYGFINRLLIPFGLHHIPNTMFWFQLGEHKDALGNAVYGDINIFLNGIAAGNNSGTFQSGFFPIMMFGLPALAAVFWMTAEDKQQKQRVLAMFGSAAVVSFLTGITEPLEFAFLFAAPALFFTHAVLTGIFGFIVGIFGIQIGFGFSAGLLDYLLSIPKSMDIIHANKSGIDAVMANPAWLWAIGAVAATTYFFVAKFMIKKFNIATPGRGAGKLTGDIKSETNAEAEAAAKTGERVMSSVAKKVVLGFGGWDNITNYQNCATRLRYDVKDAAKVDEKLLKEAGVIGVMKVSSTHVQAVVGPKVEILNNEIIAHKGEPLTLSSSKVETKQVSKSSVATKAVSVKSVTNGEVRSLASLKDGVFSEKMMGDGIVVAAPKSAKSADFFAPVSGELVTVFPTGHAYGIRTAEGVEVLVHIGVDTVNLNGKGFKPAVKQGNQVKAGDKLATVDLDFVRKNAPTADALVLVTSGQALAKKATGKVTTSSVLFEVK